MRAEIVSVGSELLLGQIVDTNAAFIARQLAVLGLDLFHKTTVGDNLGRVAAALDAALGRVDVVITTGGLGPTEDDVTREAVARATGRELEFHPELLAQIEAFFRARGLPLSPSNRRQAYIPRGAIPLPNPVGTAPCFILEEGARTLIVLPGVPREMEYLLHTGALPHIRARYGLQAAIVSRFVRVAGLGESRVGELLADLMAKGSNPTVGTMAHPGQVDVRIAAKAPDEAAARALIAPVEAEIRARLGDTVFGTDGESLEGAVATRLADQGRTLGLVEVGTGGLVSERLTSVPGMGARLESLVTTLPGAQRRLGTPSESAADLARAVRAWAGADVGAAVLMASSEGDGPNPVYPTRIGVATAERAAEVQHRPGGDLRQVRLRVVVLALDGLRRALTGPA
ncbi:MAG TPA: CinA family nicotinamide mononucleotide deamidase-related protein [Methylomirabilota bacterium]|jgi:nicotinamide-nucleotide amidase